MIVNSPSGPGPHRKRKRCRGRKGRGHLVKREEQPQLKSGKRKSERGARYGGENFFSRASRPQVGYGAAEKGREAEVDRRTWSKKESTKKQGWTRRMARSARRACRGQDVDDGECSSGVAGIKSLVDRSGASALCELKKLWQELGKKVLPATVPQKET